MKTFREYFESIEQKFHHWRAETFGQKTAFSFSTFTTEPELKSLHHRKTVKHIFWVLPVNGFWHGEEFVWGWKIIFLWTFLFSRSWAAIEIVVGGTVLMAKCQKGIHGLIFEFCCYARKGIYIFCFFDLTPSTRASFFFCFLVSITIESGFKCHSGMFDLWSFACLVFWVLLRLDFEKPKSC